MRKRKPSPWESQNIEIEEVQWYTQGNDPRTMLLKMFKSYQDDLPKYFAHKPYLCYYGEYIFCERCGRALASAHVRRLPKTLDACLYTFKETRCRGHLVFRAMKYFMSGLFTIAVLAAAATIGMVATLIMLSAIENIWSLL